MQTQALERDKCVLEQFMISSILVQQAFTLKIKFSPRDVAISVEKSSSVLKVWWTKSESPRKPA